MKKRRHLSLPILFPFMVVLIFVLGAGTFCKVQAKGVTIRFQDYLMNEEDMGVAMKEIISEFEAKFPNIKVQIETVPSLDDAIRNMESDNPPDVARIETSYLPHLAGKKIIRGLGPYIKRTGAVEYYWLPQFAEHMITTCRYKKKMYGVPQEGSPILLFINKDLFEKSGLNIEEYPRNWDQLLSYAKKLTQPHKNQWAFGGDFATLPYASRHLQAWFRANNTDFFDREGRKVLTDKKEGVEAFSFLVELHTKHHVMFPQIKNLTYEDTAIMFANENLAMMEGDFAISRIVYEQSPEMHKKTQVIFFPGEIKFVGRSSSLCMSTKSGYPDETWEYILYLTTRPSLLTLFEKARKFPARRWLYRGTIVEKDKEGEVFGKASAFTSTSPIPPAWPDISRVLVETLKEALSGGESPEQAIKDATKKIKKLM